MVRGENIFKHVDGSGKVYFKGPYTLAYARNLYKCSTIPGVLMEMGEGEDGVGRVGCDEGLVK